MGNMLKTGGEAKPGRASKKETLSPKVGTILRRTHSYASNCNSKSSSSSPRSECACDRAAEAVIIASLLPLSIIPDCGSRHKPQVNLFLFFVQNQVKRTTGVNTGTAHMVQAEERGKQKPSRFNLGREEFSRVLKPNGAQSGICRR